jgi:hypothetical protein
MGRWLKRAAEIAAQHEERRPIQIEPSVETAEITWRVAAMRPQAPAMGAIPFLVARQNRPLSHAPGDPPRCLSCGDLLAEGRTIRCPLCVAAVEQVLNEVREEVA